MRPQHILFILFAHGSIASGRIDARSSKVGGHGVRDYRGSRTSPYYDYTDCMIARISELRKTRQAGTTESELQDLAHEDCKHHLGEVPPDLKAPEAINRGRPGSPQGSH